ncbi:uncharacterized protein [Rutidosis leptorrhynchoides]|uniref:uncharacterized protein n=1 Tax=Rutidosis leptorrhynchoides TaxID=125765 RepID=UPI003A9A34F8
MKREGRQHGVVRSHPILPTPFSHKRYVKTVDPTLVTGLFTKVSNKPTNQSKFTGKCGTARCPGCHIHPATKSKDKAKGTMKLRSSDPDHGLISNRDGNSATSALAYLGNDKSYDEGDQFDHDYDYDYDDNNRSEVEDGIGFASSIVTSEPIESEDKDEFMSYCDVGSGWGDGDLDEFDGWYLVEHNNFT